MAKEMINAQTKNKVDEVTNQNKTFDTGLTKMKKEYDEAINDNFNSKKRNKLAKGFLKLAKASKNVLKSVVKTIKEHPTESAVISAILGTAFAGIVYYNINNYRDYSTKSSDIRDNIEYKIDQDDKKVEEKKDEAPSEEVVENDADTIKNKNNTNKRGGKHNTPPEEQIETSYGGVVIDQDDPNLNKKINEARKEKSEVTQYTQSGEAGNDIEVKEDHNKARQNITTDQGPVTPTPQTPTPSQDAPTTKSDTQEQQQQQQETTKKKLGDAMKQQKENQEKGGSTEIMKEDDGAR